MEAGFGEAAVAGAAQAAGSDALGDGAFHARAVLVALLPLFGLLLGASELEGLMLGTMANSEPPT